MPDTIIKRELYLVRHGQSMGNLEGFAPESLQDEMDPLLTPLGEEQAEKLGEYLADREFDAVYSSGLRRAAQTAAGIAHCREDKEIKLLPLLSEIFINPEYEGLSVDEIGEAIPGAEFVMAEGFPRDARLTVPDETPKENEERYFARAEELLAYLDARYNNGEKIVLVSHAGFLTYFVLYIMGYRDKKPYYDLHFGNTSLSKIRFYEPGTNPYGDVVIRYLNRSYHLEKTRS